MQGYNMETILGMIGAITGILGLMVAIFVAVRQVFAEKRYEADARLAFLSNVIFDTTIPRESRQPFYDEYISKKGNGTVVKFWLLEEDTSKKNK